MDDAYIDPDDMVAEHLRSPFPPPTFIDFASGDLRPPFSPTPPSPVLFHCPWLGGPHDGYPLATTLDEYVQLRRAGSVFRTLKDAALIQSALAFGLLEAISRTKIPEGFLLAPAADGTTTLSTINLPTLCRDLHHRMRVRHLKDQCRSWMGDVVVALSEADEQLGTYRCQHNLKPAGPFFAGSPQKSAEDTLRVLCMIAYSLHSVVLRSSSGCQPRPTFSIHLPLVPDTRPAQDQLRAQGWCPLTIAGFRGFVIPEYARSLRPFLRNAGEHSRCTSTVCNVNNIDPNTYIQRHFPGECNCALTIPPIIPVESLLSSGHIPVITLPDEGLTVRAADEVPYVAISHVWVDGLGSTTEEGLPACQVSRMALLTSSLVRGGAFWIDALCVPGRKDLRTRAIQLMAKTYTDAAAVLVIDAGIQSCSKYAPLEERLLRVHTSGWMQRLWTYQEAVLAKKLYFAFADGLVDLNDLVSSDGFEHTATALLSDLSSTLWNMHVTIFKRSESATYYLPIHVIARAVRWRTTSKIEDETLAIAGLLQIDISELLKASSPEERMKSLLLQKRKVSPDIIFANAPKMSSIPGLSWAPRSFMTGPRSARGEWDREELATCTPTGLLAEYAGLDFSEPVELDEKTPYVIRDTTQPAFSFLLLPLVAHVRDRRRGLCNAMLIDGNIAAVIGSHWKCTGVRMVGEEEGTISEKAQVCHYRDIHFVLGVIHLYEASRFNGNPVIEAKWCPRMKVKVV